MFINGNGNNSYVTKVIGIKRPCWEKFIMGFLFSAAILAVLCGPMLLFSTISGFVAPNLALSGDLKLEFIIVRNTSENHLLPYITTGNSTNHEEHMFPRNMVTNSTQLESGLINS